MATKIKSNYRELLTKTKDSIILSTIEGLIHWDMETMMPPEAIEQRSQQLALLSRIHHKMSTDPEISERLKLIQGSSEYDFLNQIERRNVYLINKSFQEQTALPEKLVEELARQETITVSSWKKAKAKKDFNIYKSDFQKLLELNKQKAEFLMKVKGSKSPYEALIDNFEPNMSIKTITNTFDTLLGGLKSLIDKIEAYQPKQSTKIKLSASITDQRKMSQLITHTLGYDTSSAIAGGRIDETEHPFTTGYYNDVRITTHYYENDVVSSIFSVLHETGHAIYEQNLNPEWQYQPVGSTCSYGIHESQSRFYENIIGRSREFWITFLPKIQQITPTLGQIGLNQFLQLINRVERSKIRTEADEVTYNIHIIIRFEIERDLFADKIDVNDLPDIWNRKYEEYLGVEIKDDSEGIMQDTHWASGLYGYFPSYALGNIYDGQILEALNQDLPEWRNQLSQGEIKEVNSWLKEKIHNKGNYYDPEDLIEIVTGNKLNPSLFIKYLTDKYNKLYRF